LSKPELSFDDVNSNFFDPKATLKQLGSQPKSGSVVVGQEQRPTDDGMDTQVLPGWGMGDYEENDRETGWITPDNVEQYTHALTALEGHVAPDETSHVACLTTDFAMQNVIIQMKLNLLSVDGLIIKAAQKWIKRCYACRKLCKEVEKEFCPNCGGHSLEKVSYTVDDQGNVFYNLPKQKRSLRGTKFPIPAPTGGRNSKDLILSERYRSRRRKGNSNVDLDDPDQLFLEKRKPQSKAPVFGYGKQNPNIARRKIGKKNKTNRRNNI